MNEVNRTLYIPLYGKALVSRRNMILEDPDAERIWAAEGFAMHGKAKSVWLAYNMAMRARVFDDWTDEMLRQHPDALVLLESLIEFIDFWACFGMVRISLFLHLRLLYEL